MVKSQEQFCRNLLLEKVDLDALQKEKGELLRGLVKANKIIKELKLFKLMESLFTVILTLMISFMPEVKTMSITRQIMED